MVESTPAGADAPVATAAFDRLAIDATVPLAFGASKVAIGSVIIFESALSFLGYGVRPPDTSLGLLISQYQNAFQTRPWLFWWPGLFILGIALSVNFLGDGLRDAFDPRQNRTAD